MNHLPFLSQRAFNVPLMIHPKKADVIRSYLIKRMGYSEAGGPTVMMFDDDDEVLFSSAGRAPQRDSGYDLLPGGIARIQVEGDARPQVGLDHGLRVG